MINYKLKIVVDNLEQIEKINSILSIKSCKDNIWVYEILVDDDEPYIDYISIFSKKLKKHSNKLIELGIIPTDITVWVEYEYEQQCNMEFLPQQLFRLGEIGIKLCISCWQKGGFLYFDE